MIQTYNQCINSSNSFLLIWIFLSPILPMGPINLYLMLFLTLVCKDLNMFTKKHLTLQTEIRNTFNIVQLITIQRKEHYHMNMLFLLQVGCHIWVLTGMMIIKRLILTDSFKFKLKKMISSHKNTLNRMEKSMFSQKLIKLT